MGTPSVFLASTFDKTNPLYEVYTEVGDIFKTINANESWKCHPIPCTLLDDITTCFSNLQTFSYEIFHFAGHARDGQLQLNQRPSIEDMEAAKNFWADVGGLAKTITLNHTIQLVFLNGCSTYRHVEAFKKAGIPAVIYSTMPLKDSLGAQFAKNFYRSFFKNGSSLDVAFQVAKNHIDTKRKGDEASQGLDLSTMKWSCRGMGIDDFLDQEPYELWTTEQDFKDRTWSEWPSFIARNREFIPVSQESAAPQELQSKDIPISNVHLCDRRDEVDEIYELMRNLSLDKNAGPLFLFIHEKGQACPDSLIKRLQTYGEQEFSKINSKFPAGVFTWADLHLPRKNLFVQGDAYKSRLLEIYNKRLFECHIDAITSTYTFQALEQSDQFFVIHHNLNDLEYLEDSGNELRMLLEFYLDEFSLKINTELGARLVVILSGEYFVELTGIETLFEELSNDPRFRSRIKNLTALGPISKQNVGDWQKRVFKDRYVPDPPEIETLFPFEDGERRSMKEVQKVLTKRLIEYNRSIRIPNG